METRAIEAKSVVKVLAVALGFAAAIYFLYLITDVLIWLFISLFLALAFAPVVEALTKRKLPRSLAILMVYFGMLLAIFGVGMLMVPPIVVQVENLAKDIPGYIDDLTAQSEQFRKYDERYHVSDKLKEQASTLPDKLGDAAGTLKDATVSVFQQIVALVTILVMTFFLLKDGGKWWNRLLELQSPKRRQRMRTVGRDIYRAVSGYVTGNLVISVIAGFITWLTLYLLDVPFAVPLAVFMAFMDLIPLIGATLGGITIAIVAAFVDFPTALIVWVIVLVVYQQVENHLVQPLVYKRAVNVHPLLVIVAILIGGTLMGVLGALVAIPIAAACQLIIKDLWVHRKSAPASAIPAAETGVKD